MPIWMVVFIPGPSNFIGPGRTTHKNVSELVEIGVGMISGSPFIVVGMGFEDFDYLSTGLWRELTISLSCNELMTGSTASQD